MKKSLSLMFTVTLLATLLVASACGGGAKTTTSSQPTTATTTTNATSQTPTTSQSTAPTSSTATQTTTTTKTGTTTSTTSSPPATGLMPVTTAGTKLPPAGVRVIFTDPDPKSGVATPVTHAVTGPYANCLICHYTEQSLGSQFAVDFNHPCDECHAVAPSIGFDSTHYMGQPPTVPLQDACVLCHQPA